MAPCHVNESLRAISHCSWSVGGKLIISRQKDSTGICCDSDGWYYSISDTGDPSPITPVPPTPVPFPLVYEAGCGLRLNLGHAVWKIGNAYLKVMAIESKSTATREHITLRALRERDVPFTIPEVLYHGEWDGRYYIITSEVPGRSLQQAWWSMSEEEKEICVSSVTTICKDLATWHAPTISGVDGNPLDDPLLLSKHENPEFSCEAIRNHCIHLGMDCSTFVFYHCDLNPGNVIWDAMTKSIGIIDWETAGFVPKEWIRTKMGKAGAMILDHDDGDVDQWEWFHRLDQSMQDEGFAFVDM
jgi:hypothetical protein